VNDFVEQCRREWKRLGVPDSVAEEMATELTADLNEAEADGVSARELLGNAATDPRSLAASWAHERAVIALAGSTARLPRRTLILVAIAALTIITALGAGLVLLASPQASARQAASSALLPGTGPTAIRVIAPPPISPDGLLRWSARDGLVTVTPIGGSGVEVHTVGSILLIVGIAGISTSLLLLLWSSRTRND
jgi:hypothetical protein